MKAIILARVSADEQNDKNNSIPVQLNRMKVYCENNNLEIKKELLRKSMIKSCILQ